MKKVMFIGKSGSGKTTLLQSLLKMPNEYKKTQTIETVGSIIDTPGEYMERKNLFFALSVTAMDVDEIFLVIDCTDDMTTYMPSMNSIFNLPIIGIVTKIDCSTSKNILDSINLLNIAGVEKVFCVSAITGEGVNDLRSYIYQHTRMDT